MRASFSLALIAVLTACGVPTPDAAPGDPSAQSPALNVVPPAGQLPTTVAARNFVDVVSRVEPVAEALCRARTTGVNCDLRIVVDNRPGLPPNAFQTVDRRGRPIVGFTLALIADARNEDELAFVLGHEASHHIGGHIPRQREEALKSAVLASAIAQASGADAQTAREVGNIGASIGARTYSKQFELEADALGSEIALRAGFDPIRGAQFFNRLPDSRDDFLGSHPPNAQRIAIVRATVARLRNGQP